ncbi:MAG: sugar phosphate nucleotidyltransferase [bacterium]|nr:sugar phosphate nucleotidyltransferase [bacterium]
MRRSRVTITLNQHTLQQIDQFVDKKKIRNRSHAIEYILGHFLKPKVKKAVILAGGQGTKLRPYTYEIPTALLPVKGKLLLEHLLDKLREAGITEIILSIGHLGDKIKTHFGNGEKYGVSITYSEEVTPLQTGGALLKLKKLINKETFVVVHGDILTNISFRDLIEFHIKEGSIGTVALAAVNRPDMFGQLTLQGTKLTQFYQRRSGRDIKSYLVNCGIYIFEPTIFDHFPKNETMFNLEDIIESLIGQKKINGFVFEGQWFDVGNPQNYEQAIKEFRG